MCLMAAAAGEDVREGMWREEDTCFVGFSGEKEPRPMLGSG